MSTPQDIMDHVETFEQSTSLFLPPTHPPKPTKRSRKTGRGIEEAGRGGGKEHTKIEYSISLGDRQALVGLTPNVLGLVEKARPWS